MFFPFQGQAEEEKETAVLQVEARGAALMEATTGDFLFCQNPEEKWYPASVTKVMTLLLALEAVQEGRVSLEDQVVTSEYAASFGGSQVWLKPGESFTLRELLLAIAVGSANDASVAVAEHIAGSQAAFVAQMNAKAEAIGAKNTHFTNCHGLHDPEHYTTACDLALIARYALQHTPEVLDFTRVKEYTFREEPKLYLYNTNKLLWWYPGTLGLKTGTTPEAGRSLCSVVERDGLRLISVVLGSGKKNGHFSESMKLLNYGFAQYGFTELYGAGVPLAEVKVEKGSREKVKVLAAERVGAPVKKGSSEKLTSELDVATSFPAPVAKGQVLGEVVVRREGKETGRIPLVAAEEVTRGSWGQEVIRTCRAVFTF